MDGASYVDHGALNSLRSACFHLLSAGIKGVHTMPSSPFVSYFINLFGLLR